MDAIPYGKQHVTDEDISHVVDALKSPFLTQGPIIKEFEDAFANYVGAKYAVAVSNGTAALHLSVMALELNEGDSVITSPITFAASANCIRYSGGNVIFSDIDSSTYLIDLNKLEETLKSVSPGTIKGVIPVDLAGRAVDLEKLRSLANNYKFWIIEDACHAPGGFFVDSHGQEQYCGNGEFADLAIFSFHPVKHIAAGEGGIITTNDAELYERLLRLRTHGITRNTWEFLNKKQEAFGYFDEDISEQQLDREPWPGWYMEMQELGYNYRLTDFQAALGLSQLNRAKLGIERRRQIAERYNEAFKDLDSIKGQSGVINGHAYHLYVIETDNRLELYNYLRENEVFPQVHYFPCHLMPYYKQKGWKVGDLPSAEKYYSRCLSLPMYPTLKDEEQDWVIKLIRNFFGE